MSTFIYAHKDSSATFTISADDEAHAHDEMSELVCNIRDWRLDSIEGDD